MYLLLAHYSGNRYLPIFVKFDWPTMRQKSTAGEDGNHALPEMKTKIFNKLAKVIFCYCFTIKTVKLILMGKAVV